MARTDGNQEDPHARVGLPDEPHTSTLSVSPCLCRSQFCERCCVPYAIRWRERLRPAIAKWREVSMLTLTLDPTSWESPEHAYRGVGKRRLVAELIRKLKRHDLLYSDRFAYSLEFHKSGWPHWHVIVESGYIPFQQLQECWAQGHTWISRSLKFKSASHAVHYVTKYALKADAGFPEWVLSYQGRIRRISTSRGLCPVEATKPSEYAGGEPKKMTQRTPRERAGACGKTVRITYVDSIGVTFHVVDLDLPYASVAKVNTQAGILQLLSDHREIELVARERFRRKYAILLADLRELDAHTHLGHSLHKQLRLQPLGLSDPRLGIQNHPDTKHPPRESDPNQRLPARPPILHPVENGQPSLGPLSPD